MVVSINEDVADASFLTFHGKKIEYCDKQEIVTKIEFESIVPSIKNNFINQSMVYFVNKIELTHQKYQTNGNRRDENYKGNFLFPMNNFLSFGTDFQSMYFMSTKFLKYKIIEIRVP